MEKIKDDLRKALSKQELIEALEVSYEMQDKLYDENLERMTHLQEQIEAIKVNNVTIKGRMKEYAEKLKELKEND